MVFLLYQLKVALFFLAVYIFFRLLLVKETLHALNRAVLLLSILLSAVLPLCVITVHVDAAASFAPLLRSGSDAASLDADAFNWTLLLLCAYALGVLAVLVSMLVSLISLLRLIRKGERLPQPDGTVIVLTDRAESPMSWMKFIILSREDYYSDSEAIMVHERAHIRLGHSFDVLLADLFTAMQWFNPAAWMMREDLRSIHEYEADEAVIKSGVDAKQYQLLLVKKAFGRSGRSVSNNFNHGRLKNRINMMLIEKSSVRGVFKALYLVPLVCLGLAANARSVYDVPETTASYKLNGTVRIELPDSTKAGSIIPDDVKIYIDGKLVSRDVMDALDPEEITSMSVFKDRKSIHITTSKTLNPGDLNVDVTEGKSEKMTVKVEGDKLRVKGLNGEPNVMVVGGSADDMDVYVDGKKVDKSEFTRISPEDIDSVTVKKGENPSVFVITRKK